MEADKNFHIAITRLAENSHLFDMMEDVRDVMQIMGIQALGIEGRMQDVVKEHQDILKAVEKGDALKAAKQMERHLENSRKAGNQSIVEWKSFLWAATPIFFFEVDIINFSAMMLFIS